jgi:hypothetical protein
VKALRVDATIQAQHSASERRRAQTQQVGAGRQDLAGGRCRLAGWLDREAGMHGDNFRLGPPRKGTG